MKNFLGNLAVKFQKFMYGRYGADSLYKALFWIYLAVIFIAMILGRTINFRIYYILGGAATLIIIF
ncbi:MAG: hypothetical protein LUG21_00010, partial [Clostridiales bacterium]|nr:hypothetical protein [Clostridiales bacterium]